MLIESIGVMSATRTGWWYLRGSRQLRMSTLASELESERWIKLCFWRKNQAVIDEYIGL